MWFEPRQLTVGELLTSPLVSIRFSTTRVPGRLDTANL
jgi:hypothetical protein